MIEWLRNLWPFGRRDTGKVRVEAHRENFRRAVMTNCAVADSVMLMGDENRRQRTPPPGSIKREYAEAVDRAKTRQLVRQAREQAQRLRA